MSVLKRVLKIVGVVAIAALACLLILRAVDYLMIKSFYGFFFQQLRSMTSLPDLLIGAICVSLAAMLFLFLPALVMGVLFRRKKIILIAAGIASLGMVTTYFLSQPSTGQWFNPFTRQPMFKYAEYPDGYAVAFPLGYNVDPVFGMELRPVNTEVVKKFGDKLVKQRDYQRQKPGEDHPPQPDRQTPSSYNTSSTSVEKLPQKSAEVESLPSSTPPVSETPEQRYQRLLKWIRENPLPATPSTSTVKPEEKLLEKPLPPQPDTSPPPLNKPRPELTREELVGKELAAQGWTCEMIDYQRVIFRVESIRNEMMEVGRLGNSNCTVLTIAARTKGRKMGYLIFPRKEETYLVDQDGNGFRFNKASPLGHYWYGRIGLDMLNQKSGLLDRDPEMKYPLPMPVDIPYWEIRMEEVIKIDLWFDQINPSSREVKLFYPHFLPLDKINIQDVTIKKSTPQVFQEEI